MNIDLRNAQQSPMFGMASAIEAPIEGRISAMIERVSILTGIIEETALIACGHADRLMGSQLHEPTCAKDQAGSVHGLIDTLDDAIEAARSAAGRANSEVRRFEKL